MTPTATSTVFASRDDVNTDPAPYLWDTGERSSAAVITAAGVEDLVGIEFTKEPRPEYAYQPVNPANPILVMFRQLHGRKRGADLQLAAAAWLSSLRDMSIAASWRADHTEHAHRVLRRVAADKAGEI